MKVLNKESGVLGLSDGLSSDFRDLEDSYHKGEEAGVGEKPCQKPLPSELPALTPDMRQCQSGWPDCATAPVRCILERVVRKDWHRGQSVSIYPGNGCRFHYLIHQSMTLEKARETLRNDYLTCQILNS